MSFLVNPYRFGDPVLPNPTINTILWMDGMDFRDGFATAADSANRYAAGTGDPFFSLTGGKNGGFLNTFSNNLGQVSLTASKSAIVLSMWVRAGTGGGQQGVVRFYSGATVTASMQVIDSSGEIYIRKGDISTPVYGPSSSNVPTDSSLNHVEVYVEFSSTGTYEIRLNGSNVLSGTGDFDAAGTGTIDGISFASNSAAVGFLYDDIVIAEPGGDETNSFMGQVEITSYLPTSTTQAQWSPSVAGSNHERVDDGVDGSVQYVEGTLGEVDKYGITYVSSGTIYAIQSCATALRLTASGTNQTSLQVGLEEDGSSYSDPIEGLSAANRRYNYPVPRQLRPGGGGWDNTSAGNALITLTAAASASGFSALRVYEAWVEVLHL